MADATPRLRDKAGAAAYLSTSIDTIERLIKLGKLPIVRLPVENRREAGAARAGVCRRLLIDVADLDRIIEQSKETKGDQSTPVLVNVRRRA